MSKNGARPERAIEVEGLSKVFRVRERTGGFSAAVGSLFRPRRRDVVAVEGVTFSIRRGERVAFVGPNGAGKSTTIKVLTGILYPTGGQARVLGLVPWRDRRALGFRIGTVFGQRSQLWYHLPARDTFDLLARIYELDARSYRSRRNELVDAFELGDLVSRPVRQLSLGQRMRCELVASLLHEPEVLFLDEPTIGLDVTAKSVIRDRIEEISQRDGCTILLTSHDTGDMERVCDRVIVISEGRLILDRPVSELRQDFIRRKRITLLTAEESIEIGGDGITVVERSPYRTRIEVDTRRVSVDAVVQEALRKSRLRDLTVEDPPMEEIVQWIYDEAGNGRSPEVKT